MFLFSGDTGQHKDWWQMEENNVKTSIFPLYISLDSPKDCLASAISSYAWATWKTNCLLSVFFFLPHAHTSFPLSSFLFSYSYLFTFLSLTQRFVYICFSSLTCSLPSSSPRSRMYIQAYLLTTVFSRWSPFENHLIRKACEARMSSTTHASCHPFFSTTDSLLLFQLRRPCVSVRLNLVSLHAVPY